MRQSDSFNDGITTVAVFSGDAKLFEKICKANRLTPAPNMTPFWLGWLRGYNQTEDAPVTAFESEKLTCYYDAETEEIFSYHRNRALPGD